MLISGASFIVKAVSWLESSGLEQKAANTWRCGALGSELFVVCLSVAQGGRAR